MNFHRHPPRLSPAMRGVKALSPRLARLQLASAESVLGGDETSSSSYVAIGVAFTTSAITSAGYVSLLCP
jgi:hypothetical protein